MMFPSHREYNTISVCDIYIHTQISSNRRTFLIYALCFVSLRRIKLNLGSYILFGRKKIISSHCSNSAKELQCAGIHTMDKLRPIKLGQVTFKDCFNHLSPIFCP